MSTTTTPTTGDNTLSRAEENSLLEVNTPDHTLANNEESVTDTDSMEWSAFSDPAQKEVGISNKEIIHLFKVYNEQPRKN